jgi:hypothetical protein
MGIPVQELRNAHPVYQGASEQPLDAVFGCLVTELDRFRGDGRMFVLTYPDKSKAELDIGARQAGKFKHFYLVSLSAVSSGTQTIIRRSPSNYHPLSQEELIAKAKTCSR